MKVTPSDMGVCNTSQVCIPRHPIYGETERFLHVWPKLARIFLLKSYLFTGSLWRCLSWSQANLHFGHQQFSLITDMVLPNLTLSLFPLFLNYQILYFPLLQYLTCLGICWFCKIPLTLLLRIHSSWHHSFHRITYVKYLGYCGGQKFWRHLHVS